ncbi:LysR family transcriptional regulator [Vibrio splendidus]|uniref:LysR family transcriptional regulator n=1 Tax=Vibrio splendidus TaxID=29497 RepID=UPI002469135D|nr:LysR family transcriptional regulator [Vibrio splendidus]MDH5914575.1 LysR family transcriptional regulator [Vibrio splendidus]MDH5943274.1 LysR family transcriptional regulator [Vibrio splendidus]MDH5986551.1 LysR family transcriptional regulator [Vibrio splendidus]MDH5995023.1 LysR family transcriptional regulator [Vibrio splendidus]MDH6007786.1 LysR family transcriptional regulator [Vibrio splendidus]
MAKDLFSSLDLNLLRTFLIVYQEKNTRKAAERLFVSQPAVSQALQKLRHHFNDDLFVKVHGGLQSTTFSDQLANEITPHLDGLMTAVNSSNAFDPKAIDYPIKIALSPVVLACLSGTLYKEIMTQAPDSKLELTSWTTSSVEDIQKGDVLLGVAYQIPNQSKEICAKQLVEVTGRLIVRKDHPIKKSLVTPQDLAGYDIASMISPGWNDNFSRASQILDSLSIPNKIGFRSEIPMAIIDILNNSNMYMPHSDLFPIDRYPSLRAIDILIADEFKNVAVFSHIHTKNRNNPLLLWLFDVIQIALKTQINKNHLS